MSDLSIGDRVSQTLVVAEQRGLRAATIGRTAALLAVAVWLAVSFEFPKAWWPLGFVLTFAVLGLCHYALRRSGWWHPLLAYGFVFLDVALLSWVVSVPNPIPPVFELPAPMHFRYGHFGYFLLFVVLTAFSYSPRLVLWAGVCVAACWGFLVWWAAALPETSTSMDTPAEEITNEVFLDWFLDPNSLAITTRIEEIIVALIAASLLATVVHRSRGTVRRQAELDRDREVLSESFGRYVPIEVAQRLMEDGGAIEPQLRTATILFVDIEGFTQICESIPPREVADMLNAYFDAVGDAIRRHGGVINQFQGDAILATFNVPIMDTDHPLKAVAAAMAIHKAVSERTFAGHRLNARIGINTGEVFAGSVGGAGRLNYTVHGDAVNLAARLEQLNKTYGTRILISEATAAYCRSAYVIEAVGTEMVRGRSEPAALYRVLGDLAEDRGERSLAV